MSDCLSKNNVELTEIKTLSQAKKFQVFLLGCSKSELWAEAIGTFILVFTGTGAVIVNQITKGSITHLGICFIFGAVVAALIYTLGHISGTHINPAVTFGLWRGGFFPKYKVIPYILAQTLGAITASFSLLIAFGKVGNMGATQPLNGNWIQAFILEIIITLILMLVILGSAVDPRSPKGLAGISIGLAVTLEAAFMGPITGASMNPARSIGPALVAGISQDQWVYIIAPILGAELAVIIYSQMTNNFRDFDSFK